MPVLTPLVSSRMLVPPPGALTWPPNTAPGSTTRRSPGCANTMALPLEPFVLAMVPALITVPASAAVLKKIPLPPRMVPKLVIGPGSFPFTRMPLPAVATSISAPVSAGLPLVMVPPQS